MHPTKTHNFKCSAILTIRRGELAVIDRSKLAFRVNAARGDFRGVTCIRIFRNALHNCLAPCSGNDFPFSIKCVTISTNAECIVTHRKGVGDGFKKIGLNDISGNARKARTNRRFRGFKCMGSKITILEYVVGMALEWIVDRARLGARIIVIDR